MNNCTNCQSNQPIVKGSTLCFNCFMENKDKPKKKKRINHEEDNIQEAFFRAARIMFPQLDKLLFAVPNGGFRNAREAARFKRQGVTPGIADIVCLVANKQHNCLCLETKTSSGKQSKEQIEFQHQIESSGGAYKLFRSAEEGIKILKDYLNNN